MIFPPDAFHQRRDLTIIAFGHNPSAKDMEQEGSGAWLMRRTSTESTGAAESSTASARSNAGSASAVTHTATSRSLKASALRKDPNTMANESPRLFAKVADSRPRTDSRSADDIRWSLATAPV